MRDTCACSLVSGTYRAGPARRARCTGIGSESRYTGDGEDAFLARVSVGVRERFRSAELGPWCGWEIMRIRLVTIRGCWRTV